MSGLGLCISSCHDITLAASPGRLAGCESFDNEVTPAAAGLNLKEMAVTTYLILLLCKHHHLVVYKTYRPCCLTFPTLQQEKKKEHTLTL